MSTTGGTTAKFRGKYFHHNDLSTSRTESTTGLNKLTNLQTKPDLGDQVKPPSFC